MLLKNNVRDFCNESINFKGYQLVYSLVSSTPAAAGSLILPVDPQGSSYLGASLACIVVSEREAFKAPRLLLRTRNSFWPSSKMYKVFAPDLFVMYVEYYFELYRPLFAVAASVSLVLAKRSYFPSLRLFF